MRSSRLSALQGVGVGWPGPANEATGRVSRAVHVRGIEEAIRFTDALAEALGVPAYVGNDVQVATNAEFALGAAKQYSSVLGVFWGTGVGGGIVLDGKPWIGRGSAAEVGHVVVREDGRRCPCGRRGCMEAYAGRAAMEARARREKDHGKHTVLFEIMEERGRDRLTSGVWERALQKGDPLATRLMDRAVRALGTGMASAVNVLDVEAVVIGGGLGCAPRPDVSGAHHRRVPDASFLHLSHRTCGLPNWGTWAARSAPRCSRNRLPGAENALRRNNFARSFVHMLVCGQRGSRSRKG